METVQVVEVGPRDGLQNEAVELSTNDKVTLIIRLDWMPGWAGPRRSASSTPERVPQMADAEAVMAGVHAGRRPLIGLVMNGGVARAAAPRLDEVNVPVFATETFNHEIRVRRLPRRSPCWPIASPRLARGADGDRHGDHRVGMSVRGRGPSREVSPCRGVAGPGCDELALADTIGVADPVVGGALLGGGQIGRRRYAAAGPLPRHPEHRSGQRLLRGPERGDVVDASVGGIGGCPFAPAATGNIATEDLVFMLHRAGFDTGIDLARFCRLRMARDEAGHPVPSMLLKAGDWPTRSSCSPGEGRSATRTTEVWLLGVRRQSPSPTPLPHREGRAEASRTSGRGVAGRAKRQSPSPTPPFSRGGSRTGAASGGGVDSVPFYLAAANHDEAPRSRSFELNLRP